MKGSFLGLYSLVREKSGGLHLLGNIFQHLCEGSQSPCHIQLDLVCNVDDISKLVQVSVLSGECF